MDLSVDRRRSKRVNGIFNAIFGFGSLLVHLWFAFGSALDLVLGSAFGSLLACI